ncbi:hypothetical protein LPTSP3_g02880 [Leptospira kobayashii]|uniref:DUF1398 domain-containing protein n=1 Tax=Leptospira kobayashii TaxID=1917830 RepID=A0ABM7UFK7_9LEPT|nr:DUF1398 family protein [Leptospira kobayashii]BDA77358.1 hypothetical protein LPTSP3_g02880 [Leptospira kobayashii]
MNIQKIKETVDLSLEGKITFPQIVGILLKENIESYHVDFVRAENRYYTAQGENHLEPVPHQFPSAAKEFSAEAVSATIKKVQAGKINYREFIDEVTSAGCIYYIAYLSGKRVIYFGREGEFHIEHFPKN